MAADYVGEFVHKIALLARGGMEWVDDDDRSTWRWNSYRGPARAISPQSLQNGVGDPWDIFGLDNADAKSFRKSARGKTVISAYATSFPALFGQTLRLSLETPLHGSV